MWGEGGGEKVKSSEINPFILATSPFWLLHMLTISCCLHKSLSADEGQNAFDRLMARNELRCRGDEHKQD